jgi:hypothetical protein
MTNVPGGKKPYESFKNDIKSGLANAAMAAAFKKLMPKLFKNRQDSSAHFCTRLKTLK